MALIKCSECSAEISDKAGNCPKCGAPVVAHKWRCPSCGNMINEDVCPYCGGGSNDIYSTDISGNESVISAQPEFVKKNKRYLGVLVTILVIAAVAIMVIVIGTQSNSIKRDNGLLVGEWVLDNNSSLTFYENGTALWDADVGTRTFNWDTNGNIMTWYFNGAPYSYSFEISDDVLYVDGQYYATRQ